MTHNAIPWSPSTQSLGLDAIKPRPGPRPAYPVLTHVIDVAAERAALIEALRDVLTLSDDTAMHTHDRLLAARMRAAEGLRSVGVTPPAPRARIA